MSTSPPPRPRVLVVDDEPENVRTVARVFRRELHVTGASSVAEARAELDRSSFDVALVDFSMPGENVQNHIHGKSHNTTSLNG